MAVSCSKISTVVGPVVAQSAVFFSRPVIYPVLIPVASLPSIVFLINMTTSLIYECYRMLRIF